MTLRFVVSASAVLATTAAVAACGGGGGVPKDAVASVDGTPIAQTAFTHWTAIAAKSDSGAAVPDPPTYAKCIAAGKAAAAAAKKAQTDAQLKSACVAADKKYKTAALQQLISAQWVKSEAGVRKVSVADADVKKAFQTQKTQAYPKEADYQTFLKQSGETEPDILETVKINLLATKITAQVTKGKDTVTDAEVAAYYAKNKAQFAKPETRTLRVVVNKSKAKAKAAAAALKAGGSWNSVAKKYSSDATTSAKGGSVGAVAKASLPPALATPVFSAKKNTVIGPITTGGTSYVFSVTATTPASQQTEAEAATTIKQTLQSQKQQTALTAFSKAYETRWRAKTTCADTLKISSCVNGPLPTPTPTAAAPTTGTDPTTGAPTGSG